MQRDMTESNWARRLRCAAIVAAAFTILAPAHAGDRRKMTGKVDAPVIYHNYCSVCHGDAGDGKSRARGSLVPPPADFTDVKLQGKLTREYMAAVVKDGKPGTAMVGWKTQLNDAEVAAVADYIRTAFVDHAGDASLRRGRALYGHYCVACHGIDGTGSVPAAAAQGQRPRDLTSAQARGELTRERLIAAVAVGKKGTAMAGLAGQLAPADMEAIVDYVRTTLMSGAAPISGVSAHGGRQRDPAR